MGPAQGAARVHPHGLDPGQGGDSLLQSPVEFNASMRSVFGRGQGQVELDDLVGLKTELDRADVGEASE